MLKEIIFLETLNGCRTKSRQNAGKCVIPTNQKSLHNNRGDKSSTDPNYRRKRTHKG